MSWQTYVDDHLMCDIDGHEGHRLSAAAIIGHDGVVWAQSATFPQTHDVSELEYPQHLDVGGVWWINIGTSALSTPTYHFKPAEINGILTDFDEPGHLAPTGLFLGGAKYMVIQGEPGAVIRGKKGSGGITIKKTGQALVFGAYEEPVTPGQCNMMVERLADYLIEQGM